MNQLASDFIHFGYPFIFQQLPLCLGGLGARYVAAEYKPESGLDTQCYLYYLQYVYI